MNRADQADWATLHGLLLPGGCRGCGVPAAGLGWIDSGSDYADVFGFDALNRLVEPLGNAAWENELAFWVCSCGSSGVEAWSLPDESSG